MNPNQPASPAESHADLKLLTRRSFLNLTLGATAAAPLLAVGAAQTPEPTPATTSPVRDRRIKLGVVGCGGRGAWIARLFRQHGGYEVWAVADYFPEVADACGDALGVDKTRRFSTLSGYKRLLESGIEAVALETPPYFFPEHARGAVEAGMHVYMAKPVAVDVPGCLSVRETARRAGDAKRVFLVDYQLPTDPENQKVKKLIDGGAIGPVLSINSQYFATNFPDPPLTGSAESRFRGLVWCNDVALGGGYHVNACIHAVDAALWIAGQRPLSAMGYSRVGRAEPHGDSHDVFQLTFEFENGILLNHRGKHLNNLTGFDVLCDIQGRSGFAQLGYGGRAFLKGPESGHKAEVQNLYEAGAVRNIAKFYESVIRGDSGNDTVGRSVDGALATILGREAAKRREKITATQLLKEDTRLEADLRGLKI